MSSKRQALLKLESIHGLYLNKGRRQRVPGFEKTLDKWPVKNSESLCFYATTVAKKAKTGTQIARGEYPFSFLLNSELIFDLHIVFTIQDQRPKLFYFIYPGQNAAFKNCLICSFVNKFNEN